MADELIDIVDRQDRVTRRVLRSRAHREGLLHRGVHAFLFDSAGRLLIHRRSRLKSQYPGVWDCSVSEHVRAGESYDRAVERGLFEELGLAGARLTPLVRFRLVYGPNDDEISRLYAGPAGPGRVEFDPGEVEEIAWYTIPWLVEDLTRDDSQYSRWLKHLVFWYAGLPSELQILEVESDERPFREAPPPAG